MSAPLARYQAALLALLYRDDLDLDARLALLRDDPAFAPYATYLAGVDPAFLEQGVMVTRRWARTSRSAGRAAARRPKPITPVD